MQIVTSINRVLIINSWDPTEQIYVQRAVYVFTLRFCVGSPDSGRYRPKHVAMIK
jgi:hypothetical protein